MNHSLPTISSPQRDNLNPSQRQTLSRLARSREVLTIKSADKNLGIVLLDTPYYLASCLNLLKDTDVYRFSTIFPNSQLERLLINTLINYKSTITSQSKKLYHFLQPPKRHRIPHFYGLPKVHKSFAHIPPMRPIISHTNSLLQNPAKFIDHILQPIAQSHPDIIKDLADLIRQLQYLTFPKDIILATIDVESLFPSIPQSEVLDLLYNEPCHDPSCWVSNPTTSIFQPTTKD